MSLCLKVSSWVTEPPEVDGVKVSDTSVVLEKRVSHTKR